MARKVLSLFGARAEVIKLAPVIRELESRVERFETINVVSGQHTDLLYSLAHRLGVRIDHDLRVMTSDQTAADVCSRLLTALEPLLAAERPDLVLVQGDATTAMAGALAAFHRQVPAGHVEAGLRSGSATSPCPEEINRRLITQLATYHFAATWRNRDTLLAEGVARERVFLTGNSVVDSLRAVLACGAGVPAVGALLEATAEQRRLVLTTHRRESFGAGMVATLRAVRRFVERRADVALIFPVDPIPAVAAAAWTALPEHPRMHLVPRLDYHEFVALLAHAWLIVTDSGAIQEEAPTLGKPVLVLRDRTERPEAVECGAARLVGRRPEGLELMLEEAYRDTGWGGRLQAIDNPFGRGDSAVRIVEAIAGVLGIPGGAASARALAPEAVAAPPRSSA